MPSAKYYQEHREYYLEYSKKQFQKQKELGIKRQHNKEWFRIHNKKPWVVAKRLETTRRWRERNKERVLEYAKKYKREHLTKIQKYYNRLDVKEKLVKYRREYRKKNPEVYLKDHQKRLARDGKWFKLKPHQYQFALSDWSNSVRKRDGKKCQICNSTHKLQAHHILHRRFYPKLSLNLGNGLTLCFKCHNEVHGRNLINFS